MIIAMVNDIGEFLADVVKISGIIFWIENFNFLPINKDKKKFITKNNSSGINNFTKTIKLASNKEP
jgi:hypothetical protein